MASSTPWPFYHTERDPVFVIQSAGLCSGQSERVRKFSPPPGLVRTPDRAVCRESLFRLGGIPAAQMRFAHFNKDGKRLQFTYSRQYRVLCVKIGCPNLRILSIPLVLILTHCACAWIGTTYWQKKRRTEELREL